MRVGRKFKSILSLIVCMVMVVMLSGNNLTNVFAASTDKFITLKIYDEYGRCIEMYDICGDNKKLTCSDSSLQFSGNSIRYVNKSYFGRSVKEIKKEDSENIGLYMKDSNEYGGIIYDASGNQTCLELVDFLEMTDTEFNRLRGATLSVYLQNKLYTSKFKTSVGVVQNGSMKYSSEYTLKTTSDAKNYVLNLTVTDGKGYDLVGWRCSADNKLYKVGDIIDMSTDKTYTAEFKAQMKTITYIGYDKKAIKTEQAEFGTTITLPETAPEVEGKEFAYWCSNDSLGKEYAITNLKVTDDKYVYAVYTTGKCKVIYTDGTKSSDVTQNYGTLFQNDSTFDKRGYDTTWYDMSGKQYIVGETRMYSNVTVIPTYIPHKLAISIESNGGEVEYERCMIKDGLIEFGETIIINGANKYGYSVSKVKYNDDEVSKSADGKFYIEINKDTIAKIVIEYGKNKHNYTIKDSLNNSKETESGVYYMKEITLPNYKEVPGYTFKGWQLSTGELKQPGDVIKMPNENLVVAALWENVNYTLTIDLDGGAFNVIDEVGGNTLVLNVGETYTMPNPVKDGYEFTGWTITSESSEITKNQYKMGTSNDTIKANWTKKKCQLTIIPNGGFYDGKTTMSILTGGYGDVVNLGTPTRTGYTFAGWEVIKGDASCLYDNKVTYSLTNMTIGATWLSPSGQLITNSNSDYVKPVDGTVEPGVILQDNSFMLQYDGETTKVTVADGSKIGIDKTNGVQANYGTVLNKDYELAFSELTNITTISYKVVTQSAIQYGVSSSDLGWEHLDGNKLKLNIKEDGEYMIYFIVDTSRGKKIMFRSTGFTVDNTRPLIRVNGEVVNNGDTIKLSADASIQSEDSSGSSLIVNDVTTGSDEKKIVVDGSYTVSAVDNAGNGTAIKLLIDKTRPVISIKNNTAFNKSKTIKFSDATSGIAMAILYDNTRGTQKKVTDLGSVKIKKEGKYRLVCYDAMSNKTAVTFYLDKKKATCNIKNGKTYRKNTRIVAKDSLSGVKEIRLNNKKVKNNYKIKKAGRYTLVIKDKAGNKQTIKFKVK